MNAESISDKWRSVTDSQELKGYRALRISADCIPDLFLGVDFAGRRCLLLFLPKDFDLSLKNLERNKLHLQAILPQNILLIRLTDDDFHDLFDDLIISFFMKIKGVQDHSICVKYVIEGFNKWAEFLEKKPRKRLSEEDVKGLFGEVFLLNEYLIDKSQFTVNEILESWRGPYGEAHDFVFPEEDFEVKTKGLKQADVSISSEFQLEREFDKKLYLVVISVVMDLEHGVSLSSLLLETEKTILEEGGDVTILHNALMQHGLTIRTSRDYDNYRFRTKNKSIFDCNKEGFPSLSVSSLPKLISRVRYNLRVNALGEYLMEEVDY